MGLDHYITDKNDILIEWRKEYWISSYFHTLFAFDDYMEITREDVISFRDFCKLALHYPRIRELCDDEEEISDIILERTITKIDSFLETHNDTTFFYQEMW